MLKPYEKQRSEGCQAANFGIQSEILVMFLNFDRHPSGHSRRRRRRRLTIFDTYAVS